MMKSKKGTMKMMHLQPEMKEIEARHGANKQKYNEEVQKLYRRENVNPLSGCIWTLIPFPILIALYYAIRCPITTMMGIPNSLIEEGGAIAAKLSQLGFDVNSAKQAYIEIAQTSFISKNFDAFAGITEKLKQIDYSFLGLDLGAQPKWNFFTNTNWSDTSVWLPQLGLFLIPIIAAVLTYFTSVISRKMNPSMATNEGQQQSNLMMDIMMPLMTLWFAFIMPAALGIYWIASSFFGIIQDVILTKIYGKKLDAEDTVRQEARRKEEELAKKREATERLRAENATVVNPNTSKKKQQTQQKQQNAEKALEWDRKNNPKEQDMGPSQVGNRRYARGRAYDPDRYSSQNKKSVSSAEKGVASVIPEEKKKPKASESEETFDSNFDDTFSGEDNAE